MVTSRQECAEAFCPVGFGLVSVKSCQLKRVCGHAVSASTTRMCVPRPVELVVMPVSPVTLLPDLS